MLKLGPILMAVIYGLMSYRFSVWRLHRTLDSQSRPLVDPSLAPILSKLAKALDQDRVLIHLYEIDPVNGLAAPDGRIFITRGFYNKYLSGEVTAQELASVIAHELGHVALGHTRRRMIDFTGQNAIRTAATMVLGRIIPGVGPMIAGVMGRVLMAKLSRNDEFEADAYATALMMSSGLDPTAQTSLLDKLETLTQSGPTPPAWLMSHPKTPDRITAIQRNLEKWRN